MDKAFISNDATVLTMLNVEQERARLQKIVDTIEREVTNLDGTSKCDVTDLRWDSRKRCLTTSVLWVDSRNGLGCATRSSQLAEWGADPEVGIKRRKVLSRNAPVTTTACAADAELYGSAEGTVRYPLFTLQQTIESAEMVYHLYKKTTDTGFFYTTKVGTYPEDVVDPAVAHNVSNFSTYCWDTHNQKYAYIMSMRGLAFIDLERAALGNVLGRDAITFIPYAKVKAIFQNCRFAHLSATGDILYMVVYIPTNYETGTSGGYQLHALDVKCWRVVEGPVTKISLEKTIPHVRTDVPIVYINKYTNPSAINELVFENKVLYLLIAYDSEFLVYDARTGQLVMSRDVSASTSSDKRYIGFGMSSRLSKCPPAELAKEGEESEGDDESSVDESDEDVSEALMPLAERAAKLYKYKASREVPRGTRVPVVRLVSDTRWLEVPIFLDGWKQFEAFKVSYRQNPVYRELPLEFVNMLEIAMTGMRGPAAKSLRIGGSS